MNFEMKTQKVIDAKSATGDSGPLALPPGRKIFHLSMASGTATMKIQGSVDGTNWTDLHTESTSASAAEKDVELDDIYPKHRVNVSAWTSGVQNASVAWPVAK
jgi:hypothetical protein